MRYTTIIDIREFPTIYRNINCRMVYLHLCLSCGYHDSDRDISQLSLRRLAEEVGITLSATRNALRVLEKHGLVSTNNGILSVTKWVSAKSISKRQEIAPAAKERAKQERKEELQRERERQEREELHAKGKTQFMIYYEAMMEKASQGDEDAQRIVRQRKEIYESHKKQFENKKSDT